MSIRRRLPSSGGITKLARQQTAYPLTTTSTSVSDRRRDSDAPLVDPYANIAEPLSQAAAFRDISPAHQDILRYGGPARRLLFLSRLRPHTIFYEAADHTYSSKTPAISIATTSTSDDSAVSLSPSSWSSSQALEHRRSTSSNSVTEETAVLEDQLDLVDDAIAGTCQWIKSCPEYDAWRAAGKNDHNVLVIVGDLSTGKSVLLKSLQKELSEGGNVAIPFFCDAGLPRRNSVRSVIASFIYYTISRSDRFSNLITTRRLERDIGHSFDELWSLFIAVMNHPQALNHVFLIDALEQCDGESLRQFQTALRRSKSLLGGKLLITTRPDELPDLISPDYLNIRITVDHISSDIVACLDKGLQDRNFDRAFTAEMVQFVRKAIGEEVRGMFLLIEGKLQEFDEERDSGRLDTEESGMRQILSKFPRLIKDYFFSILGSRPAIQDRSALDTTIVMSVLLAAQQSSLSDLEIQSVLDLTPSELATMSTGQALNVGRNRRKYDVIAGVQRVWGPFVDVKSERTKRVGIMHSTYKTFLTESGDPKSSDPVLKLLGHISPRLGHAILASVCLESLIQHGSDAKGERIESFNSVLLPYSLQHWHTHMQGSGSMHREQFIRFVGSAGYDVWSAHVRRNRPRPGTEDDWWRHSLPFLPAMIQHLVPVFELCPVPAGMAEPPSLGTVELNAMEKDDFGTPALILALQREQYEVVHNLLDLGASVNSTDARNLSALHIAVIKQRSDVVGRLLAGGASCRTEAMLPGTEFPQTPLLSSISSPEDIFSALLSSATTIDAPNRHGWALMHECALQDDVRKCRIILDRRFESVDTPTNAGYTPIMVAAGSGHALKVTKFLVSINAKLHLTSSEGSTALYEAAYHENFAIVSMLLQHDPPLELGRRGWTPLHAAAFRGSEGITKQLIDAGANVRAVSEEGETPLTLAVKRQSRSIVNLLLQRRDGKIDSSDDTFRMALLLAASKPSLDILHLLLRSAADPAEASRSNMNGWSCLHAAAYAGLFEHVRHLVSARRPRFDVDDMYENWKWTPLLAALCKGHYNIANFLLAYRADANIISSIGWSALHMTVYYTKDEPLLRSLLELVDQSMLSALTAVDSTPVSLAAETGFATAVRILVHEKGVETLVRNKLGRTPLYYAANAASPECVDILFSAKNYPPLVAENGWTALHAACKMCPGATVEKIALVTNLKSRYQVGLTPLHIAIAHGNNEAVDVLLKVGIDPDVPSDWGTPPLLEAAANGNSVVVRKLLERGAKLTEFDEYHCVPLNGAYLANAASLFTSLRPPPSLRFRLSPTNLESFLHVAAAISLSETQWALGRSEGSKGFFRNVHHQTPLEIASANGHADIVAYLLTRDNSLLQSDTKVILTGWTPLHIAVRLRHEECVRVLKEQSTVDAFAKDCFGLTAFHYAYGCPSVFVTLCELFPDVARAFTPIDSESTSQKEVDNQQIEEICRWRLDQIESFSHQFHEADSHLAAYALVDPLMRLKDEYNARMAVEIFVRPSAGRSVSNVDCQICGRQQQLRRTAKKESFFVCKVCPFRLICKACKERSQRQSLKGCFQHSFLEFPSDSWYDGDVGSVKDHSRVEEKWLRDLSENCRRRRTALEHKSFQKSSSLFTDFENEYSVIFRWARHVDMVLLFEYLQEYPRAIGHRDSQGATIVMHILMCATDDGQCLQQLKAMVELGARLLCRDKHKTSSVEIACEKGLEKTLTFLLEQWDSTFDHEADEYTSTALQTMIDKGWGSALHVAVERHLNWCDAGNFHQIIEWSRYGWSAENITIELLARSRRTSTPVSSSSDEGIWAPLEQAKLEHKPVAWEHREGCAHNVLREQRVLREPRLESRSSTSDDESQPTGLYASFSDADIEKLPIPEVIDSSDEDSDDPHRIIAPQSLSDSSDDVSHTSQRLPNQPLYEIDTVIHAITPCGFGGLFPNSNVQPSVERRRKNSIEAVISYGDGAKRFSPLAFIVILQNAVNGLLQALRLAHEAGLSCMGYTFPRATDQTTIGGHPIVELCFIPFSAVEKFVQQINKLSLDSKTDSFSNPVFRHDIKRSAIAAHECVGFFLPSESEGPMQDLHYCCLTVQFLSLSFALFLLGFKSKNPLPTIRVRLLSVNLAGSQHGSSISVAPVTMECISDMLQDDILVFKTEAGALQSVGQLNKGAYLAASIEDFAELWGPCKCFSDPVRGGLIALQLLGGELTLTGDREGHYEVAHWSSDPASFAPSVSFSEGRKILIGAHSALRENPQGCRFDYLGSWGLAENSNLLQPVNTRPDVYRIAQRQFGISAGGPFGNANVQQVHAQIRGYYQKDALLRLWEDENVTDPQSLNSPWGLVLSVCTGNAKRVPLRVAIGEVVEQYMTAPVVRPPGQPNLSSPSCRELWNRLRKALIGRRRQRTLEANEFWRDWFYALDDTLKVYVKVAIIYVLQHLERTGYDSDTKAFRIAWPGEEDARASFTFSCSRTSPFRWLKVFQDSTTIATFAVATKDCLIPHNDRDTIHGLPSCRSRSIPSPVLPDQFSLVHTKLRGNSRAWNTIQDNWHLLEGGGGKCKYLCKFDVWRGGRSGSLVEIMVLFRRSDYIAFPFRLGEKLTEVRTASYRGSVSRKFFLIPERILYE